MTRILITGGRGVLGSQLIPRLQSQNVQVRLSSRSAAPVPPPDGLEWAQADLLHEADLSPVVEGVDTIIHAASNPAKDSYLVEVEGTRRLLDAAQRAGVGHFVYISIVGIDKIPFAYYQHKLAAEQLIAQSAVPWTILRATQFYELFDRILMPLQRLPLWLLPTDFQSQPIDTGEAAQRLVELALDKPAGYAPDIAGPQVMRVGEIIRTWQAVTGVRRPVLYLPLPGKVAAGFRRGYNTIPQQHYGTLTWEQWLIQKYRLSRAYGTHARQQNV